MEKVLFILYIYVCPISVFTIRAYHDEYFEQEKTWFEAQRTCNNSGGWLTSNKNNVINCNQVTKGATFWTGEYSRISHWISKIGCIELLGEPHISLVPTVSKCLEICRMQHTDVEILGHIENRCVCILSNKPSLRKLVTIHQCSIVSNNSYWAYSVTQNQTLNGSENCVFVKCQHKPMVYTAACKDKRKTFCDIGRTLNWMSSQEYCKHDIPGNLSEICKAIPDDRNGVWLPMHRVVLRTDVLHDGIDNENAVLHCASYRCYYKTGVSAVLMNNPCRITTNGFFCTFASSHNETTERSYTPFNSAANYFKSTKANGTSEKTANAFKVTGTMSLTRIIKSSNMLQTATNIVVKLNENRNFTEIAEDVATSDIGLIVGGVLGALSIIGVVVLVVIIKLRGKAATKRQTMEPYEMSKDNSAIDEDTQRQKTSNDESANTQYEEDWAHAGRFFAEKIMETAMVNSHDRNNLNDAYAVVMKDNMTSPLQGGQDSEIASHEAIDSEYDRLNITPQFLRDNTENNLYDSSLADRCESDPTYNTATDMIHSRQNNEDVYDRI